MSQLATRLNKQLASERFMARWNMFSNLALLSYALLFAYLFGDKHEEVTYYGCYLGGLALCMINSQIMVHRCERQRTLTVGNMFKSFPVMYMLVKHSDAGGQISDEVAEKWVRTPKLEREKIVKSLNGYYTVTWMFTYLIFYGIIVGGVIKFLTE